VPLNRVMTSGVLLLALSCVSPTSAELLYSVTDLGTFGGTASRANDINDSGQVVGCANTKNWYHAFLYSNGTMTDLGTLSPAFSVSEACGINATGQIVGSISGYVPFLRNNGNMDMIFGGSAGRALDINGSGQVVGYTGNPLGANDLRAVLYSNGTTTDLGTLGGAMSGASAVNDGGQVAGWARITGDVSVHAFLYSSGTMRDLGTLVGGSYSGATDINASGQVVGNANTADGSLHAFLCSNGAMTDLGTLGARNSYAEGINDREQVVGYCENGPSGNFAFLYNNGTMADLNTLIEPSSGWTLTYASAINSSGWIVGAGINPAGQSHAFLLVPIPEPSTLILLATGIAAFLLWCGNGESKVHIRMRLRRRGPLLACPAVPSGIGSLPLFFHWPNNP
jgi:probable HAF family extracellular repeat protein